MAGTSKSLQYLTWLKSKTVNIYSAVQRVKLLLVLSILYATQQIFLVYQHFYSFNVLGK